MSINFYLIADLIDWGTKRSRDTLGIETSWSMNHQGRNCPLAGVPLPSSGLAMATRAGWQVIRTLYQVIYKGRALARVFALIGFRGLSEVGEADTPFSFIDVTREMTREHITGGRKSEDS